MTATNSSAFSNFSIFFGFLVNYILAQSNFFLSNLTEEENSGFEFVAR